MYFYFSDVFNWYTFVHFTDHSLYFICEVKESCPTRCDPMDYRLPGSSICGIFQARILEWVAVSLYITFHIDT